MLQKLTINSREMSHAFPISSRPIKPKLVGSTCVPRLKMDDECNLREEIGSPARHVHRYSEFDSPFRTSTKINDRHGPSTRLSNALSHELKSYSTHALKETLSVTRERVHR